MQLIGYGMTWPAGTYGSQVITINANVRVLHIIQVQVIKSKDYVTEKKAVIILPPYLYLAEGMKIMMLLFVKVGMRVLYIRIGIRTTGATEMGDIVV